MLRLLKADPSNSDDSACSTDENDAALDNEPGIYADRAVANSTLYTFLGPRGEPLGYVMIPDVAYGGMVPREIRAIYDRCVAATSARKFG